MEALRQQADTIDVLRTSLVQQGNTASVMALTPLIEQAEQRVETVKSWGIQKCNDENHYINGIKTAPIRIQKYQRAEMRVHQPVGGAVNALALYFLPAKRTNKGATQWQYPKNVTDMLA